MMGTSLTIKIASRHAENIIFGKRFLLNYIAIGAIIFAGWIYVLYKTSRSYFDGEEKKASAILCQLFSIIILTIFINVYYTYEDGKNKMYFKNAVIKFLGNNIKTGSNYVTVNLDGREERFSPTEQEYKLLSNNDSIILKIGKAANGY